ncbi:MAG: hypothetical protein P0Y65_14650 [Candidatus Devosia phytovorans]|uniref:Uncharacterized protein n=1 Tax=Candidatus Devosia phytovorans TaxID=3121372 RepID=A0AAJ6AYY1_9HYPH|nr:hypothetical protein [Devosia sp.]WEK03427.1 MAG: hypothetical protein P0Y65_14650 [Devosia sp.]
MRRSVIAASLLLTTSATALAQNLDALSDGLNHLPATVLIQQHGDIAYFVDVQVVKGLAGDDPDARPFFGLLGGDILALQSLPATEQSAWEAKAPPRWTSWSISPAMAARPMGTPSEALSTRPQRPT